MPTTELRIDRQDQERRSHLNRRRRRPARRKTPRPQSPSASARPAPKNQRRRHIDPTTCERDYSNDEVLFMRAMDEYKRKSGRMFPTWSEVLEVLHCLGYRRVEEAVALPAYKTR